MSLKADSTMNDRMGDQFNNTTSAGGGQPQSKSEGIAPVFIGQLIRAPEGNFQMWDMSFNMVTMVLIVRSTTKRTYQLEDHTGQTQAHCWLEEDNPSKTPDVMINAYARVYGSIRQHGGKKMVMIFKMHQLEGGLNELKTHMLEVYTARCKAERYSQKKSDFMSVQQDNIDNSNTSGLTTHQSAVLNAIRDYMDSECGISLGELHKRLSNIPTNELREIVEFLVTEGIIYTSIDAEHFLSA